MTDSVSSTGSVGIPGSESRRDPDHCPFCRQVRDNEVRQRNHLVAVLDDNYPRSDGHVLVIPLRHCARLSDLSVDEVHHMLETARQLTADQLGNADGYTIGINDGAAAGQTIPHVHLHVIPRRVGDVPNPKGGLRQLLGENDPYISGK